MLIDREVAGEAPVGASAKSSVSLGLRYDATAGRAAQACKRETGAGRWEPLSIDTPIPPTSGVRLSPAMAAPPITEIEPLVGLVAGRDRR